MRDRALLVSRTNYNNSTTLLYQHLFSSIDSAALNQEQDGKEILPRVNNSLETCIFVSTAVTTIITSKTHVFKQDEVILSLDSEVTEKEASLKGLGIFIGLAISLIAAMIWYVQRRYSQKKYVDTKKEVNAWYARFSVASRGCQDIITVVFAFLPDSLSFLKTVIVYLSGTIAGCCAVLFLRTTKKANQLFTLGNAEGWSAYISTGSSVGALVGGAIGAVIGLLLPIPFTLPICIGLFSAIGGLIGAIATALGVPLVNKIAPEHDVNFRLNYPKTGALLGGSLGSVIGFVIGLAIPLPGASIACAAIGAGIGGLIGSISLAMLGPKITRHLSKEEDSHWDHSMRHTAAPGKGLGTMIGYGFERLLVGAQDIGTNIGILITSGIGLGYELWTTYRKNKRQAMHDDETEKKAPPLRWDKRIYAFAGLGTAIGMLAGVAAGPLGMVLGAAVGATLGSVIGLVAGNYLCNKMERFGTWLTKKIDAACSEEKHDDEKKLPNQMTMKEKQLGLPPCQPIYKRLASAPIAIPAGRRRAPATPAPAPCSFSDQLDAVKQYSYPYEVHSLSSVFSSTSAPSKKVEFF